MTEEGIIGSRSIDGEDEEILEEGETELTSVARLTDGSGYLIMDGDQAGRRVHESESEPTFEIRPIPDRDTVLNSNAPIFLVHRPYQNGHVVPRLLARIHAFPGQTVSLGYISKMSLFTKESHLDFASQCGASSLRIIDPEGYMANRGDLRLATTSDRALGRFPHLSNAGHNANNVLDFQRERGSNLLLSSGSALDASSPAASLQSVLDEGDAALANLNSGERLALNLTMSQAWLSNSILLNQLLDQLLDQEQFDVWYLRIQWRNVNAHAQPIDVDLLQGYKRLCQLALDEGRHLILPQSGLTGWLMLGFGAAGFGTGMGGMDQGFKEHQAGGSGAPQIERFFERQILHTIERSSIATFSADPSFSICRCPYCSEQALRGNWSHPLANLHSVYSQARLTSAAGAAVSTRGGLSGHIRRSVRSAVTAAARTPLTGISEPRHLRVWDRLI